MNAREIIPEWRRDPLWKPEKPRNWRFESQPERVQARLRRAWASGQLRFLLDSDQQRIYDQIRAWMGKPFHGAAGRDVDFVFDCSRRYGKTLITLLILVEERIRRPRSERIVFWTITQAAAIKLVMGETYHVLFASCPPEMKPTWEKSRAQLTWMNDSAVYEDCRVLEVLGFDSPDAGRGGSLAVGAIDEAGFIMELKYIVESILTPMFADSDSPAMLLASTPPKWPGHYFATAILPAAKARGAYAKRVIFEARRLSNARILQLIKKAGGIHSTTVRREFFLEQLPDNDLVVFPEAHGAIQSGRVLLAADYVFPEHRACFTSIDPGWGDATGVVFGSIDFANATLLVEDEWLGTQATTGTVAQAIADKERALWHRVHRYDRRGQMRNNPKLRISDINNRMIGDLNEDHGLRVYPTLKDDKDAQINRLRLWLSSGKVKIHPRCEQLLEQLSNCVWQNAKRRTYARQGAFGHFDLVDALIYLCRNTDAEFLKNPHPREKHDPVTYMAFTPPPKADALAPDAPKSARMNRIRDRQSRRRKQHA